MLPRSVSFPGAFAHGLTQPVAPSPSDVPPPQPPSGLRPSLLAVRYVVRPVYTCSGNPMLDARGNAVELSLDFLHTVADVERVLNRMTTSGDLRIISPAFMSSASRMLELCRASGSFDVEVYVEPTCCICNTVLPSTPLEQCYDCGKWLHFGCCLWFNPGSYPIRGRCDS